MTFGLMDSTTNFLCCLLMWFCCFGSLNSQVPDFEDVNRPLPMPKEKIEEIKENLQHSHSSSASPVTPDADIKKSERVSE